MQVKDTDAGAAGGRVLRDRRGSASKSIYVNDTTSDEESDRSDMECAPSSKSKKRGQSFTDGESNSEHEEEPKLFLTSRQMDLQSRS